MFIHSIVNTIYEKHNLKLHNKLSANVQLFGFAPKKDGMVVKGEGYGIHSAVYY